MIISPYLSFATDFPSCHSERSERGSPASTGVPSELVRWGGSLLAGAGRIPAFVFCRATNAGQKSCQAPRPVQKPSMLHHPDKIKNPAKMHLSYAPSCTINVVGLNRKDPASKPGLPRVGVLGQDSSPDKSRSVRSGGADLALT